MTIAPKCHFCDACDGHGCVGELPGMGGVFDNANFIENVAAWARYSAEGPMPRLRLAPITGAQQNVGYEEEGPFYFDLVDACASAGLALSIGDGYPDEKLKYGIEALRRAGKSGAVFIKPYPNARIEERMEWARDVAEIVGVDIDSYNIVTMRNLANLERKSAADLAALRARALVPFAVKGVCTDEDVELVRELKPDVVVVSNHGGRVETRRGSTADFLAARGKDLARHAGAVWVDGGIRSRSDLLAAGALGAKEAMVARPFITALLRGGAATVRSRVAEFLGQ